jgi:hypothetical protein
VPARSWPFKNWWRQTIPDPGWSRTSISCRPASPARPCTVLRAAW